MAYLRTEHLQHCFETLHTAWPGRTEFIWWKMAVDTMFEWNNDCNMSLSCTRLGAHAQTYLSVTFATWSWKLCLLYLSMEQVCYNGQVFYNSRVFYVIMLTAPRNAEVPVYLHRCYKDRWRVLYSWYIEPSSILYYLDHFKNSWLIDRLIDWLDRCFYIGRVEWV